MPFVLLVCFPTQMVGKLRVRLSCVQPNQPVTAMLPLLSERKKGAQQVGTAEMTLQVRSPLWWQTGAKLLPQLNLKAGQALAAPHLLLKLLDLTVVLISARVRQRPRVAVATCRCCT